MHIRQQRVNPPAPRTVSSSLAGYPLSGSTFSCGYWFRCSFPPNATHLVTTFLPFNHTLRVYECGVVFIRSLLDSCCMWCGFKPRSRIPPHAPGSWQCFPRFLFRSRTFAPTPFCCRVPFYYVDEVEFDVRTFRNSIRGQDPGFSHFSPPSRFPPLEWLARNPFCPPDHMRFHLGGVTYSNNLLMTFDTSLRDSHLIGVSVLFMIALLRNFPISHAYHRLFFMYRHSLYSLELDVPTHHLFCPTTYAAILSLVL